ncbi:tripartite tricarboxylate transporter substrate binding protein [Alcaligenaceae bacterium LF4-65]|jgi:tripartite-type tricarboxylate transporter receptor subunit TctC|uniref:Tripartite tricarboxylate transporter substrate binding protein n=1 Tax=Zwartia hollandica TaxID=324606 RepID=A0A953NCJ2_9BURK|nr:tripartite tricarboxylate transporter substrate binding protein [Zwartia hollandica]MBZ1351867.1 tripartite tricarboxylate transporter substrate binding protein [Zwartia hollandica]
MDRRKFIEGGLALGAVVSVPALAQSSVSKWPSQTIKLIVAFGPGGSTDVTARIVSAKLMEIIGQRIVIENKPGGGSNIGSELAAKSPADGYTLFLGTVANAINMSLFKNPGYDLLKDFEAISNISSAPALLVSSSKLPVKTVQELIQYAKERPGKMNYASSGVGTTPHLAGEMFKQRFGLDIAHIAYKGAAPALTDTIGGVTDFGFKTALSAIPSVQSGQLRALAVAAPKRLALMPDVPTMAEAGVPNFDITSWNGLFAPAKTPREIVDKLSAACAKIAAMKDVQETFAAQAAIVQSSTPEQFRAFVAAEIKMWGDVVRSTGATAG